MSEPSKPSSFTTKDVLHKFKNYVRTGKTGLKRFYNPDGTDKGLEECAARGSHMTKELMAKGCPREVAAELTILALWDLVVLIGTNCLHLLCYSCVVLLLSFIILSLAPSFCFKVVGLTHGI